ncbi:MAG: FKBP-type peptidyl-prolyl cis-trans isomerase [Muribaculaceae bacterium]|nr:FKBP-type peptidyl-prolyl cis-trans isomerase [Muribaculaceae bacterium]
MNKISSIAVTAAVAATALSFGACSSKTDKKTADTLPATDSIEAEAVPADDSNPYNAAFFTNPDNQKGKAVSDSLPTYDVTASGLKYAVVTEGTGASPKATDAVEVHYTGRLLDGTVFDSSIERGETITFPLQGVIKGWTEGLQLMKEGGTTVFYIPSDLAYGEQGTPGGPIPPNAPLIFEVQLIKVNPGQQN